MNTDLLLSWLNLPPGPWPPEDRVLLDLPPGAVHAGIAEQSALARMEQLRPHQLLHPELVTEGMNRLAQALLTVLASAPPTEEVAVTPVKSIQSVLTSAPIPPPVQLDSSSLSLIPAFPSAFAPGRSPAWQPVALAPDQPMLEVGPAPLDLAAAGVDAEVLDAEVIVHVEPDATPSGSVPRFDPEAVRVPASALPPPGTVYVPQDRRAAYHQLVNLRRILRAWDLLGPYAAQPRETIAAAASVFGLIEACGAYRAALARAKQHQRLLQGRGRMVDAVARSAHPALVLRELQPEQRNKLAADWVAARRIWQAELDSMRDYLRSTKPRNRVQESLAELGTLFRRNPEWVLVFLSALILALGFVRQMLR